MFVATTFSTVNAIMPAKATHIAWDKGVWDFNVENLLDYSITVNIDGIDHVIPPARIGSNGFRDSEDCTTFENGFTRDSVLTYNGVKIPALITDETYPYLSSSWKDTFDECRDIPECRIVAHTLRVESNGKFFILGLH
ncbi:MAG: hypothetical protein LBR15_07580 [Methanobrevibacter sp.]|nr:hypothetical protein [Candidatus Methanovirga australis]